MNNNTKGILYGIISSATFGMIPFFAIPVMRGGMATESILFYRFFLSALIMGGIVLAQKKTMNITLRQAATLFVLGIMYASTANLLMESYKHISSGLATSIHFLYPAMVALIMTFVFKEQNSKWLYVGVGMAIAGIALLCTGEGIESNGIRGVLFAMGTILTYASFIVGVNRNGIREMDGHVVTFYVLLFGSLLFLSTALFHTGEIEIPARSADIVNLVLLALIPTMVSDLTLVLAIKHIGSTVTSVLGSMEPITAIIFGVLFFHEAFSLQHFLGIVIVVAAITIVIVSKARYNTRHLSK